MNCTCTGNKWRQRCAFKRCLKSSPSLIHTSLLQIMAKRVRLLKSYVTTAAATAMRIQA
jgi:hypothetical protein